MNDEKRLTRLLPFRGLRRAGPGRVAPPAPARGEDHADAELRQTLAAWEAPAPAPEARARLAAAYRAEARRATFWRRWLTARMSVPAPVAAGVCVALLVALSALFAAPRPGGDAPAASIPSAAGRSESAAKVVEAPAPRERVVTRFVYVERKPRRAPRRRARAFEDEAPAGAVARAPASGAAAADYFTRIDMGEFRPAGELKIRLVRKGKGDDD
jgi:hypothetical protein